MPQLRYNQSGIAPVTSANIGSTAQADWETTAAWNGLRGRDAMVAARRMSDPNYGMPIGGYKSGGYGGYSGGMGGIGGILGDWQAKYDEARNTNLNRYDAIRGGAGQQSGGVVGNGGAAAGRGVGGSAARTGGAPAAANGRLSDADAAMGGYLGRYQRGMGLLEQLGGQEKADVAQRYDQQAAAQQQDLTSRGLSGTTVLPTMKMGIQREKSDALNRVNQRLIGQRMAADAQLSGDQLAFMERRTDAYPDARMLAQMLQQYGQTGGGQQAQVYQPPMQLLDTGMYGGGFGFQVPGMGGGRPNMGFNPMMMRAGGNPWMMGGGGGVSGGASGRFVTSSEPSVDSGDGMGYSSPTSFVTSNTPTVDRGDGILDVNRINTTPGVPADQLDPYWTLPSWDQKRYVDDMTRPTNMGVPYPAWSY